ncbi:ABC transporter permease [Cohnella algarum]|uniref:ABC transporter permease n=1 Tax=Cohnella algarum TaxID=2044859 RepID=UPI0019676792|nr:ABC-2 family transporter protein [Cohnella algarum]MBN2984745.1 ABC-2 family transporter protein [Cohnella algarum]
MHSADLYLKSFLMQWKTFRTYKANFWFGLLGVLFNYGSQFMVVWTVLHYFKEIAGWNLYHIIYLYGMWLLTYGLMITFFSGIRDFSAMIHNGDFDILLIRPHSILFQVLCGKLELTSWTHILFGSSIVYWCSRQLHIVFSMHQLCWFILLIIGGVLIQAGLLLVWAALSFWIVNTYSLVDLGWSINANYLTYPLHVYDPVFKYAMTFFPLAFISYYPTKWLLGLGPTDAYSWVGQYNILIGIFFFSVSWLFFLFGIKHYKSTGN